MDARCLDCPELPNGVRKRQICCRRGVRAEATGPIPDAENKDEPIPERRRA